MRSTSDPKPVPGLPGDPQPLPLLPLPSRAEMERAYQLSDASYDGVFFLGVRTTGIFCRPSCPARKPKPENVEFFAMPKDALFAGYRQCLRCRPLEGNQAPEWVSRLLERIERQPDVRIKERELRDLGVEPARVRRYFLSRYGLTFQAYCRARRLSRAFERIRDGEALDDAVFETGYESHSGFREAFLKAFGQPPGRSADASCIRLAWIDTPLGPMVAGATDKGVCLLEFTDRRMLEHQLTTLQRRFKAALAPADHPHLTALRTELAEYFAGTRRTFDVPIDAPGTPFEERVWRELSRIPFGETRSYEEIARNVATPAAVRAVGRANGMNRLAIVIPCHRVLNKSGELGGYGGGLWRKRRLLHLERSGA
ncbi:MAG TPA: methylated-DNA--[protein]-cysteine S-methyltransferase [Vicinamibacterales bacterium]|nr:methylated-DNA--[protein]-cysteine S-methyltransferase [Vicinamibacterales bacterium]